MARFRDRAAPIQDGDPMTAKLYHLQRDIFQRLDGSDLAGPRAPRGSASKPPLLFCA